MIETTRRRGVPGMAAAVAMLALCACTTASIEDAAPVSAAAFPAAPASPAPAEQPPVAASALQPEGAPRLTGAFPNLNNKPDAAAEQITAEEKLARLSELKTTQQRTSAEAERLKPADDQDRLRKLGTTHGADALKTIEDSE